MAPGDRFREMLAELALHDPAITEEEAWPLFREIVESGRALSPTLYAEALEIVDRLGRSRGTFGDGALDRAFEELRFDFDRAAMPEGSMRYLASGAVKDVFQLVRHPGVVLAISKSPKQNALIDREVVMLNEMASRDLRVVRAHLECLDAPGREMILTPGRPFLRNRRAFVMHYIDGGHAFPLHGVDADPARIPVRSSLFRQAMRLGVVADAEKRAVLIEDLEGVLLYCAQWPGCVHDLQGMIERSTGHFYVTDPAARATEPGRPKETALKKLGALIESLKAGPPPPEALAPPSQPRSRPRRRTEVPAPVEVPAPAETNSSTWYYIHTVTTASVDIELDDRSHPSDLAGCEFAGYLNPPGAGSPGRFALIFQWEYGSDHWTFWFAGPMPEAPPPSDPSPPSVSLSWASVTRDPPDHDYEYWEGVVGSTAFSHVPVSGPTPYAGTWSGTINAPGIPGKARSPLSVKFVTLNFEVAPSDVVVMHPSGAAESTADLQP